eukprot:TRINITY_DN2721_c0_g3_i2.p1 TRINITY_DN2721_c0_g3~~TRINITY_DN2721_c0_g3_i2.p1  ORF type:complete len:455 (+),score=61.64 TRINITY_DN2721_c0_g3_i2:475-1839(+)
MIERLNEKDKAWEILHVRMPFGNEAGLLLPSPHSTSEFIIAGGCDNGGPVTHVLAYDLTTMTARKLPSLQEARDLPKGIFHNNSIFIFGGEWSLPMETMSFKDKQWKEMPISFDAVVKDCKEVGLFSSAQPTLNLEVDINGPETPLMRCANYALLFGNDVDPRILEIDMTEYQVRNIPIPFNLKLLSYQSGIRLGADKFLLAGGLDLRSCIHVSRGVWLYNRRKAKCKRLPKMRTPRYAFSFVNSGDWVYAIGGRSHGEDAAGVLASCERFHLREKRWEELPPLNIPRVSSVAFVIKDRVFVGGGYVSPSIGQTDTIEVFNDAEHRWKLLGLQMREAVEGAACFVLESENSVLIFGGKNARAESLAVWKLSFSERMDAACFNLLPPVLRPGSLLKAVRHDESNVMILGGSSKANFVQFYNVLQGKAVPLPAKLDIQGGILHHSASHETQEALLL